jgi:hypothetical protein
VAVVVSVMTLLYTMVQAVDQAVVVEEIEVEQLVEQEQHLQYKVLMVELVIMAVHFIAAAVVVPVRQETLMPMEKAAMVYQVL